ncbi:hypothetical protein [Sporomusa malonica]|uniref:Uncharacterized protein n=1 Tax=Sporomusa malonica TaxID=112901 RepID=A0A1W2ASD9_9FIRM|nr:hypothetical protein [Sporomusa malonica]SMC63605.1 hypothetical protein SAMN04488500_10680 [Sporomusa malonica]
MEKNSCDYYKAVNQDDRINCPNCQNWGGAKCEIEDKVKRNDKTEMVHEPFRNIGRSSRVTRVFK